MLFIYNEHHSNLRALVFNTIVSTQYSKGEKEDWERQGNKINWILEKSWQALRNSMSIILVCLLVVRAYVQTSFHCFVFSRHDPDINCHQVPRDRGGMSQRKWQTSMGNKIAQPWTGFVLLLCHGSMWCLASISCFIHIMIS